MKNSPDGHTRKHSVINDPYLFIVNPHSGTFIGKNPGEISASIRKVAQNYGASVEILFTEARNHATSMTAEYLPKNSWRAVVAVGGDGTVNEVAKVLVDGRTSLGILPLGSGNGLARHLGIPISLAGSLNRLFSGNPMTVDSARLNDIPFFCTAGFGFDAYVGHLFSQQPSRGLATYVSVSMRSYWNYKPQKYVLNGKPLEVFSLSFANAGQYGNNAWIAPEASLQDGMLDICTIRPFPLWYGTDITYRLFSKNLKASSYISYQRSGRAIVESDTPPLIHYDGEPMQLDTNRIEVIIKPGSLKIIV